LKPYLDLNCHTPRAVLFGSLCYEGLNLPELYSDQGIGQPKWLVGHLKLQDEVGQMILNTSITRRYVSSLLSVC